VPIAAKLRKKMTVHNHLSPPKRVAWTVGIASALAIISAAGVAWAGDRHDRDDDDDQGHRGRRARAYYHAPYPPPPIYYRAPPPVAYVPVYPAPAYDYPPPMYYGPTQPSVTLTVPLR
jgi:hypothetical protein